MILTSRSQCRFVDDTRKSIVLCGTLKLFWTYLLVETPMRSPLTTSTLWRLIAASCPPSFFSIAIILYKLRY